MAFVLRKGVIRIIEAKMRSFLWQGGTGAGMAKVAWSDVCKPMEVGGQGIRQLDALNRALMSRHLWAVLKRDQTSIWVTWVIAHRLKTVTVWTTNINVGSWSWRKILRLHNQMLGRVKYSVGTGEHIKLWQDPWHHMGVLIHRFPRGPQATGIPLHADLAMVIQNGEWEWPEILDTEHRENPCTSTGDCNG
ncbi:UNVERIFIED_CONTAM: hypothetical protein Slati_0889800 [Sesamum latifolium]|uniref:Uncharacterized protein n=1 Tax=Sesamum latifolium TaxID=2727402 RepID=A0AAW2XRW3_9LAMI